MSQEESLRIFVAMPGTEMGSNALWNNPEEIKIQFYKRIQEQASERLSQPVELFIEKDKPVAGVIYTSMYSECWKADIYIADLTGSNANVYLELGARWALRDGVTIPVTQSNADLKFNVLSTRAILYSQDPIKLQEAVTAVVTAIEEGLKSDQPDNPIKQNAEYTTIDRKELAKLKSQVEVLLEHNRAIKTQQGIDYIAAGTACIDPVDRISWFRRAHEANPESLNNLMTLVKELRIQGFYDEAIQMSRKEIEKYPNEGALYGELGLNYRSKGDDIAAVAAFQKAVELSPSESELWGILGGALRRLAFNPAEIGKYDVVLIKKARDCYEKAFQLKKDAYVLGNLSRLDFLLSYKDPTIRLQAREGLKRLRTLCENILRDNNIPKDSDYYYRHFDLADTYLLSGEVEQGKKLYFEAIKSVPVEYRNTLLASVISPLEQFVEVRAGEPPMRQVMEEIIRELKRVASAL